MAETSYLWDNPGTGDSPALGYGNALLNQVIFRMLFNGTGDQGVLLGWLNDLEVTDNGDGTVNVDTGAAFNYGVWYENTAVVNVAITDDSTEWVVVRASWAAQTSRLAAIAPGAFTQTPGVTYDIPLAEVTDVAGAITLITDLRDYCEYSTDMWPFGVSTDMIVDDAVTVAKIEDQSRAFMRGGGSLEADITNAATWANLHTVNASADYKEDWTFPDAATSGIWLTYRVPEDHAGGNVNIDLWVMGLQSYYSGDVRWTYSIWQAAAGAVAANTTGAVVTTVGSVLFEDFLYFSLVSQAATAGDVMHIQINRDGTHVDDTYTGTVALMGVHFEYTADS